MASPSKAPPLTRRGRRPGSFSTRQAVLDAARARFATDGFAATTIRRVALDARVDASQVMQFFRSKNELFAAVMAVPASLLARIDAAMEGPDEQLGERFVRAHLEVWLDEKGASEPLMAMLRSAVAHEEASLQLRHFLQSRLLDAARNRGHVSADLALRAGLAAAMLVGLVVGRRIIQVPLLVQADTDKLVTVLAPAIQELLVPRPTGRASR